MKRAFLTGLMILLPVAITLLIIRFCLDLLTEPFIGFFEHLLDSHNSHSAFLLFLARLFIIISLFVFTLLLGYLARKFFFSYLVKLIHRVFERIPVVKTIYRLTKDVVTNLFTLDEKPFKKTVLVNFPYMGAKVLAFLTGKPPRVAEKAANMELHSIFVPTAPHPISGFVLLVKETDFKDIDISTEDVFKFLLSCGTYEREKPSHSDLFPNQTEPGKTH